MSSVFQLFGSDKVRLASSKWHISVLLGLLYSSVSHMY